MPLDRIDRTGVIRWFEGYSATAPGGANSALLVLRQIMNHAVARGHIEDEPDPGRKEESAPPSSPDSCPARKSAVSMRCWIATKPGGLHPRYKRTSFACC